MKREVFFLQFIKRNFRSNEKEHNIEISEESIILENQ